MKALSAMAADIVASYVRNHEISNEDLPKLILRIEKVLASLSGDAENLWADSTSPKPAVPISRSIAPDHLICLEDGESRKLLKRHLRTKHGLSPESYRSKWGLPADYPMVAPNYERKRSQIAKDMGFGRVHTRWSKPSSDAPAGHRLPAGSRFQPKPPSSKQGNSNQRLRLRETDREDTLSAKRHHKVPT